jgi:hypothetical protein
MSLILTRQLRHKFLWKKGVSLEKRGVGDCGETDWDITLKNTDENNYSYSSDPDCERQYYNNNCSLDDALDIESITPDYQITFTGNVVTSGEKIDEREYIISIQPASAGGAFNVKIDRTTKYWSSSDMSKKTWVFYRSCHLSGSVTKTYTIDINGTGASLGALNIMPSITSPEPATDIHNDPEWEDIDGNQGWIESLRNEGHS